MQLRPYQERNLNEILACLQRKVKGTLYMLPTGAGKTQVFTAVTDVVTEKRWKVAIIVHRRELLEQASDRLKGLNIRHGLIAPGHDIGDHQVYVASVDTISARFAKLQDWITSLDLIIIDEAHHAVASKWRRVVEAMREDALLLGVTATPYRLDGKGLGEFFDEEVKGPSIKALTDDGYLSPAHVHQPPLKINTAGITMRGGDYVQSELARRMDDDDLTKAAVVNYARFAAGVPSIAFCAGVDHARHVAEAFTKAGWRAESVDGTLSTGERDRRIKALGTGDLQVLTSCDLISEGTDVPIVGSAILLRPTKSTCLYLQQIGRVLRPFQGKDASIIIDMVGNVKTHGMPDAARVWTLYNGIDKRQRERATKNTRRCPKRGCWRVHEWAAACPGCGYQYTKSSFSADARPPGATLTFPTGTRINGFSDEQIREMPYKQALRFARTEQQLRYVATVRNYSPGWVYMIMKQREKYRGGRRWR